MILENWVMRGISLLFILIDWLSGLKAFPGVEFIISFLYLFVVVGKYGDCIYGKLTDIFLFIGSPILTLVIKVYFGLEFPNLVSR